MSDEHERFMRLALEEAAIGKSEGNSAVGSVIVRGGQVIARGRNLVQSTLDPTAHAETVAIRDAGPVLGSVDFSGCTLYTTFEPCPMCCTAIILSGIERLVMGGRNQPAERRWPNYTVERFVEQLGWQDRLAIVTGVLTEECLTIRQ